MQFKNSMILRLILSLLSASLILTEFSYAAEKKVALIVGNGDYNNNNDYSDEGDLLAVEADINAVRAMFEKLAFDEVITAKNVNRREFRRKISEFREASTDADVAIFYYTGHGLVPPPESKSIRQNYLVPTGVDFSDPEIANDLESEMMSLSYIRRQVERPGLTTVFMLDACRNNPFGGTLAKSVSSQIGKSIGVQKGLVIENTLGSETFVAFAARQGEVAIAPTNGGSSYFTQALVEIMPRPDSLQNNLSLVRGKVLDLTSHRQKPQTFGELNKPLYLGGRAQSEDLVELRDSAAWEFANQVNSKKAFGSYIASFPNGLHSAEAKMKMSSLPDTVLPQRAPINIDAERFFEKGLDYLNIDNHDKAIRELSKAGNLNHAEALYYLGWIYGSGDGVLKSYTKAAEYLERSAKLGSAKGNFQLGKLYRQGAGVEQSDVSARKLFLVAAEKGDFEAQYALGSMYEAGVGGEQSNTLAAKWFVAAAEGGLREAQAVLGSKYLEGEGVMQSYTLGAHWSRLAAEQGDADAMYNLGALYNNGMGVARSPSDANYWFKKASNLGHVEAIEMLKSLK